MPRYEYECALCHVVIDCTHSMKEKKRELYCPRCAKSTPVRKLISQSDFKLSWRVSPHPGKRTKLKEINGHYYDEASYAATKARGLVK